MRSGHYDDVVTQGRRGTVRLALVGGLAVLAVAAAAVALVAWARPGDSPAVPVEAAVTSGPAVPGASALATPGLAVAMPADLVWHDVRGVALPYSASGGPRNTLGGLASGFAHDAAGAVLAAAHIVTRINPQLGPDVFGPTLREQVVGPEVAPIRATITSAYARLREQAGVPYGDPVGQISAALRGFRVEDYTDTDTDVRLVTEGPDGKGGTVAAALLLHMRWSNGDWVVVVPAGGDFIAANVRLDAASLYTPFGVR